MSEARVLVAGANGYAGALAAHLVHRHPQLELTAITSRSDAGKPLAELYPDYDVPLTLEEPDLERLDEVDAAIVSYPHGAAAPVVAELRGLGALVVDLSADFRLRDLPEYERWYGPHGEPDLLEGVVYGLTELNRRQIRTAQLIANPGCYPTAALLALAPMAETGLIDGVVIDAKSGVSGAGRAAAEELAPFVEDGDFKPYKVDGHRHSPEITQELRGLGVKGPVTFVPHLLPTAQGLLASCFVTLTRETDDAELRSLYEERYVNEPFVEVVADPPGIAAVRGTNGCQVHVSLDREGGRALAFAAIDNLWKGAAGQAVQNLNLMLDLDETLGLL